MAHGGENINPRGVLEKRVQTRAFIFFLFVTLVVGCSPPKPTDVVARVGGDPIYVKDLSQAFYREGDKFGPEPEKDKKRFLKIKEQLLEDLIQKKILIREAKTQGVEIAEPELEEEIKKYKSRYTEREFQKILEERKIDYGTWREIKRMNLVIDHLLREKLFSQMTVPEEKLREYYEQHRDEFTRPEAVRIRQIVTDTKEKAEEILKRLKQGENFARVARDLSLAPDRKQGGDLGFVPRGSFPKEFEICFDLKVGELSPIVSSLYGFHIFKVVEKRSQEQVPFDEVKGQIEEWLKEKAREEAFDNYYKNLKGKIPVEVNRWTLKRAKI